MRLPKMNLLQTAVVQSYSGLVIAMTINNLVGLWKH